MSIRNIVKRIKAIGRCVAWWLLLSMGVGCQSELQMSSSITVHKDRQEVAVNPGLYGWTLEEINHGMDGGLYA